MLLSDRRPMRIITFQRIHMKTQSIRYCHITVISTLTVTLLTVISTVNSLLYYHLTVTLLLFEDGTEDGHYLLKISTCLGHLLTLNMSNHETMLETGNDCDIRGTVHIYCNHL